MYSLCSTLFPYQLEGQYYKVTFIFDDLFQPSLMLLIVVCVADDLFQSCRPGDFDVTPTTVGGCSTYTSCFPTGGTKYICF